MKLALLAAAVTLVALPTADVPALASLPRASGNTVVLHDASGDVFTFSNDTTGYQPAVQPAADVLRAHITHGRNAVVVRMVFDDLSRVNTQWYWYDVHTKGVTSTFVVEAAEGHWRGLAYQEVQGEWVHVPGLRAHIDYATDVVELRISRALLGRPTWVRVRLHNELGLPDHNTFFTDNPGTATPTPAFTPRLPVPTR